VPDGGDGNGDQSVDQAGVDVHEVHELHHAHEQQHETQLEHPDALDDEEGSQPSLGVVGPGKEIVLVHNATLAGDLLCSLRVSSEGIPDPSGSDGSQPK